MPDGFLPATFSVSQLTTFLGCPRKYRFRYIDGLPPERRSANMSFGTAVHSAIEWWVTTRRETGGPPPIEEVHRIFRADWTAATSVPGIDFEHTPPEEWRALGQSLLVLFTERMKDEVFTGCEERFEIILTNRGGEALPVPLVGVYDLLGDGFIAEIKTAARKTGVGQWILQLSAYSIARRLATGKRPAIKVIELLKTKVPKIEVEETMISDEQEAWFTEVAVEAYRSIEAGACHPSPSWMCEGCEYRKTCRASS